MVLTPPIKAAVSGSGSTSVVLTNPLNGVSGVPSATPVRLNGGAAATDVAKGTGGTFGVSASKIGNILDISASAATAKTTSATLEAAVKR